MTGKPEIPVDAPFSNMTDAHLVNATGRDRTASPEPVKVFYDGACALCRTEIDMYRRRIETGTLQFVDASGCDESALPPGLDRTGALARFHVQTTDHQLVSGAAAFAELWKAVPGFGLLGRAAGSRHGLRVFERFYRLFLAVRPTISRAFAAWQSLRPRR